MSIFHSISAFCNAGFDIIGAESLKPFQTSGWITLTLASLVIVGGLGFSVLTDLQQYPRKRSLKLHSRFVLLMTVLLIVFGMIIILGAEYDNPLTLGPMSLLDKLENAFFQSITPRTAGFSAIDQGNLTSQSQGLTMLLMFIGGSPGSTAGGIKTVTFGLLIATVISVVRGRDDTEIFHRRISNRLVNRAIAVMVISLGVIVIPILILVTLNPHLPSSQIMFETMSAYGTVGLSTGITAMFSEISKFILVITMFIGRVGPLTVLFALAERARSKNQLRYPEGRIHIG
jgi:trk system potassium uptake protein TrkH